MTGHIASTARNQKEKGRKVGIWNLSCPPPHIQFLQWYLTSYMMETFPVSPSVEQVLNALVYREYFILKPQHVCTQQNDLHSENLVLETSV